MAGPVKSARISGYTLIEVLLVLAVISAFAAIVWPPLLRMYGNYQLKEAAEEVRSALAKAHLHALDEGIVYQFRFEPDGQHYLVLPNETEFTASTDGGTDSTASDQTTTQLKISHKLREGWKFGPDQQTDALYSSITDDQIGDFADSRDLETVEWSAPLLFYPDGTAANGSVQILDAKQRYIRLSVRDLTGAVSVSRVMQSEQDELERLEREDLQ